MAVHTLKDARFPAEPYLWVGSIRRGQPSSLRKYAPSGVVHVDPRALPFAEGHGKQLLVGVAESYINMNEAYLPLQDTTPTIVPTSPSPRL